MKTKRNAHATGNCSARQDQKRPVIEASHRPPLETAIVARFVTVVANGLKAAEKLATCRGRQRAKRLTRFALLPFHGERNRCGRTRSSGNE